jgi:hypothetical protein
VTVADTDTEDLSARARNGDLLARKQPLGRFRDRLLSGVVWLVQFRHFFYTQN